MRPGRSAVLAKVLLARKRAALAKARHSSLRSTRVFSEPTCSVDSLPLDLSALVDLKATAETIISTRTIARGWKQLLSFLAFFVLFCTILIMQSSPTVAFALDQVLRNQIVDEGGAMQGVTQLGDVFDYLTNTIMPNVFQSQWYNGDSLTRLEKGYVLDYNKLVGGLLIVQERAVSKSPCRVPYFSGFRSSYEEGIPAEKQVLNNITKFPNSVPWASGIAAPPAAVNATRSQGTLANFWQSFCYDADYGGFASFLALADGSDLNLQKLAALQQYYWLDEYTRKLSIKFAVYNGYYKCFLFVNVRFQYDVRGIWSAFGEDGGVSCEIKAVRMEPYRIGSQYRDPGSLLEPDAILLILEIVFLVSLFSQISDLQRTLVEVYVREGWQGREKIDARTGDLTYDGGLRGKVTDPFILLDIANYLLFLVYVFMRVSYIQLLLDSKNVIKVPTNKYEPILETASHMVDDQLLYNLFNMLLMLLRCFKHYRFQPRLALINKTLSIARVDLYCFLLVFLTILVAHAVMANLVFGQELTEFSSLGMAVNTCFMYLLICGVPYFPSLAHASPTMATIFFVSFNFLMFVVLLSFLLAIIVDSYAEAMAHMKRAYPHGDIPSVWTGLDNIIIRALDTCPVSDRQMLHAISRLRRRGAVYASCLEICDQLPVTQDAEDVTGDDVAGHWSIVLKEDSDAQPETQGKPDPPAAAGEQRSAAADIDAQIAALKKLFAPAPAAVSDEASNASGHMTWEEEEGVDECLFGRLDAIMAENDRLRALYARELAAGRLEISDVNLAETNPFAPVLAWTESESRPSS